MGCPYSSNMAVRCGDDGVCSHSAAGDVSPVDIEFGCYGSVVNETAYGPPAFSAEQRKIIKETWAKISPQSTAVGKQVLLLDVSLIK